jgi:predicted MFS family arabinose efflux permease
MDAARTVMAGTGRALNGAASARSTKAAWEPFYEPLFRSLWVAAVISYTGSWMQNVGAGWLMTSLTMNQARAPLMVGLVQAAQSLPVFLVALPAGALADMVDRRRFLLVTQTWMTLAAAALAALTFSGLVTPWVLLGFTFLLGFGAVVNDPAWQAITPEIVSAPRFASAVALNSAGFNVARSLGPALGGLVIAAAGSGTAFVLNAFSFLGVIWFLLRWRRPPHRDPVPGQRVWSAIGVGVRYVRKSDAVRAVLVRTGLFSLFASALWALLPLLTKNYGSVGYGLALGALGAGAVVGAALLPILRRVFSINTLVVAASLLFAVVTAAAGYLAAFGALCFLLFFGGIAWISVLASLNLSAQTTAPSWVRARALSVYLLVLQGGMAAGSAAWGALAGRIGVGSALAWAATGLVLGLPMARSQRLEAVWLEMPPPISGAD